MTWRNALIACAALLVACVGDQKAKNGAIQLVNAVPDGPLLSLVLDSAATATFTNVDYRVATGFAVRGAGPVRITVAPVVAANQFPPIDLPATSLATNDELTIVALGRIADASLGHVEILNKTSAVPAGQTRVQFLHGAGAFPAVDVYLTDNAVTDLTGVTPLVSNLMFKQNNSRTLITATNSGRMRITSVGDPATVLFDSGQLVLPAEGDLLYTILENFGPGSVTHPLAISASSGVSSSLLIDQGVGAELRVVHAAPQTLPVDITLQDTSTTPAPALVTLTTGLGYRGIFPDPNGYSDIPAATYTINFLNSADGTTLATSTGEVFQRGSAFTVVLDGLSTSLARLALADNVRRVATEGRVRVVNLAPSAATGVLDLYVYLSTSTVDSETARLSSSGSGTQTGYLSLAPGIYNIAATVPGSKTEFRLPPQTLTVEANKVYTALIVEDAAGGTPPALSLLGLDDFP
jgi:hypothetical protein